LLADYRASGEALTAAGAAVVVVFVSRPEIQDAAQAVMRRAPPWLG
jgi:hypothetical protein